MGGLVLGLAVLITACDAAQVAGPLPEAGNVEVTLDATVVQSDSGVVVNGQRVISHPDNGNALWVDRFERFDFGGFPELDYAQSTRYSLSWRVLLTHGHPPEQRGDSVVFRFHDHGDVTVADVPMDRLTDVPHVAPGVPVRFENFVRYHLPTFTYAEWHAGGSTTFEHVGFHDDLVAGNTLTIRTTGSEEARPVDASFALRPFTRLAGVENDGAIDLAGPTPLVDVDHAFIFTFDRPVDPDRTFIVVHPMAPQQPNPRSAFIRPLTTSHRVVIPPYVLRELAPVGSTAFRAIVVEFDGTTDAFAGHFTNDEPFALPFVQRAETSVHLYLVRSP